MQQAHNISPQNRTHHEICVGKPCGTVDIFPNEIYVRKPSGAVKTSKGISHEEEDGNGITDSRVGVARRCTNKGLSYVRRKHLGGGGRGAEGRSGGVVRSLRGEEFNVPSKLPCLRFRG